MAGRTRILIVEDESDIREVMVEMLSLFGYATTTAKDGQEGWKAISANKFDLIITDLGIPKINGLELSGKIRAKPLGTPILLITGVIFDNADVEIKALAPCELLLKPFKIEDLKNKIESMLIARAKDRQKANKLP